MPDKSESVSFSRSWHDLRYTRLAAMRRSLLTAVLVLGVGSAGTVNAEPAPGPSPNQWHLARSSYVAVGSGGSEGAKRLRSNRYAASGFDVRGVSDSGHGGFARFEEGTESWFEPASAQDPHVLALDVGYSFGGPLVGAWEDGLLGFFELGLTGWHATDRPVDELGPSVNVGDDPVSGFGVAYGASVEGRVAGIRLGLAVQRRDIPFFVGGSRSGQGYATSTTLQLRVNGEL